MIGSGRAAGGVEVVRFNDLDQRGETWAALAARSRNVFASWEWCSVWWRHFGGGKEACFSECRRDGEPFAILPVFVEKRRGLRLSRLLGQGPGDVLGAICAPEDAALAGRELRRAMAGAPSRIQLAERLPGGAQAEAFGGRLLLREANPSLEIAGRSWEDYVSGLSRNTRENVRRGGRKAERAHEIGYRLCDSAAELERDFETLLRLHRDRWGADSTFLQPATVAFHRDLAEAMLAAGRLRLWTMTLDDQPVAAWYGFRHAGVESFYQSGRDRAFDHLSVGSMMLIKTIKAAFDDGLERYAFLRGDESYKDRFADLDRGLETRIHGEGPLGDALVALTSQALRWPALRRRAGASLR